jgi:hypothetical protein
MKNINWEVSFWPNNQPPVLLGMYSAPTEKEALKMACKENDISVKDKHLNIAKNSRWTPIKRWRNQ